MPLLTMVLALLASGRIFTGHLTAAAFTRGTGLPAVTLELGVTAEIAAYRFSPSTFGWPRLLRRWSGAWSQSFTSSSSNHLFLVVVSE